MNGNYMYLIQALLTIKLHYFQSDHWWSKILMPCLKYPSLVISLLLGLLSLHVGNMFAWIFQLQTWKTTSTSYLFPLLFWCPWNLLPLYKGVSGIPICVLVFGGHGTNNLPGILVFISVSSNDNNLYYFIYFSSCKIPDICRWNVWPTEKYIELLQNEAVGKVMKERVIANGS